MVDVLDILILAKNNMAVALTSSTVLSFFAKTIMNKRTRLILIELVVDFVKSIVGKRNYRHNLFRNRKTTLFLIDRKTEQIKDKLKSEIANIILTTIAENSIDLSKVWAGARLKKLNKKNKKDLYSSMRKLHKKIQVGCSGCEGYEELIKKALCERFGYEKGIQYYNIAYVEYFKTHFLLKSDFINDFFDNLFYYDDVDNDVMIDDFLTQIEQGLRSAIYSSTQSFHKINGQLGKI